MIRQLGAAAAIFVAAAGAGCHPGTLAGPVTPGMAAQPGWTVVPNVPLVRQQGATDCGVAALAMVLRYWQPTATAEEVRAGLAFRPGDEGVEAGRLRAVARSRGLEAFLVEGTLDDLGHGVSRGRPVIVGLVRRTAARQGIAHYVVVVGVNAQSRHLLTADPQRGWTDVTLGNFGAEWLPAHRLALVIFPREAQASSTEQPAQSSLQRRARVLGGIAGQ
jgi:ABC-type bacteriocin/lantibiotic exporter with double-glycine peptidase domain